MGKQTKFYIVAASALPDIFIKVAEAKRMMLVARLAVELREWSERLPELMERFPTIWNSMLDQLEQWYAASPSLIRSALDLLAGQLMEEGPSLAGTAGTWLMGVASSSGSLRRPGTA